MASEHDEAAVNPSLAPAGTGGIGAPEHRGEAGRPARMAPMARLPVFFALAGKRVVLAGGSEAAAWKAELIAATGADVFVYEPDPSHEMANVAAEATAGTITLVRRPWGPADLAGAALAIGDCENADEARAFADAARAAGVVVNVIDKPAFCDFAFGSIVNRSPLVIAISSDGGAPTLTQAIRVKIEAMVPKGIAAWIGAAKAWRPAIAAVAEFGTARRRVWERFARLALDQAGRPPAESDLQDLLASHDAGSGGMGEVMLVGAGPGDPDLLTLKAVRALQAADVVLYDKLVGEGVLDYARREAKTMPVGKTGHGPSCKQTDINDLMVKLAREGRRVVRLKGGDPSVFGRSGEEIAACRAAGVPITVVPGITTATAAAASLGVSLTHRDHAQRLQFVTGHNRAGTLPPDLDLDALADPRATTCLYMGRNTIGPLARQLLARGAPADLPAIWLTNVSRSDEAHGVTDLGTLAGEDVAAMGGGPVIVLIGRALGATAATQQPDRAPFAATPEWA
jgi:uroporphyrin-III C-methyltransferase/precorrin-2 dehydrogenase/sirohydrochlorin ferrochelatase